jgi:3-oxoadipate enol-lactonase
MIDMRGGSENSVAEAPVNGAMPRTGVLPPGRAVRLAGRGTTFVREVTGPPGAPTVVLLHGLAATAGVNWFSTFNALGRHFRVVALDQRGHGRGIRPSSGFALEDCADDVVALADSLGVERFIPVGYSMGGPVALLTWRRHPGRVAGLVLCATAGRFARRDPQLVALGQLAAAGMSVSRAVLDPAGVAAAGPISRRFVPGRLRVERAGHEPAALMEAGLALSRFDASPWLSTVDVPAAVVVTTDDRLVPPAAQVQLAHAVTATIHPVDGGHDVCIRGADRFVPVLVDACQQTARRTQLTGTAA